MLHYQAELGRIELGRLITLVVEKYTFEHTTCFQWPLHPLGFKSAVQKQTNFEHTTINKAGILIILFVLMDGTIDNL